MRHIAFAAIVLAWPVQPAFARGHSDHSHSAAYQHHRIHARSVVRHHHFARRHHYHYRHVYVAAQPQNSGAQFGAAFPFVFGAPMQPPRQRASRHAVQPQYFGGYSAASRGSPLDGLIAQQASANGVPLSLVHRVIRRESGYNPRAVSRGNYGLMQIRLGTARAMGYGGSAAGLLDAGTNMTYAVRYLAGAYRAAGGNESRAVALYASGYRARAQAPAAAQGYSPYAPTPVAFLTGSTSGGQTVHRVRHHRRYRS